MSTLDLKEQERRPETEWLAAQYDAWRISCGNLSKGKADEMIYERMYGKAPAKNSDLNKIRFWRTGRHLPVNREDAESFADALDFDMEQKKYFFRSYMELYYFENEEEKERAQQLLADLKEEYLMKIPPFKMEMLGGKLAPEKNFRHLYYLDALSFTSRPDLRGKNEKDKEKQDRMVSVSFGSELLRIQRMEGEISRKSMLRHLILLGSPFVSARQINSWLEQLGFAPLDESHVSTGGIAMDALLIRMLACYEELAAGREYLECEKILRTIFVKTDEYLQQHNLEKWRIMYFKSLKNAY